MSKRKRKKTQKQSESDAPAKRKRDFTALKFSLIAYALLWLSMPPVGFAWFGWIAMAPIVWLIQTPQSPTKVLRQVWVATLIYWLVTLHFVRLPFWALWFGWILLSVYLSVYGVLFVAAARTMVHRFRIPTVIAAPVAYTGMEWVRVNFLTGFGMVCHSHSQYQIPASMQVVEFFGAYGLTFAMVMVSAAIAVATRFWKSKPNDGYDVVQGLSTSLPARALHAAIAVAVIAGVLVFGTMRLAKDASSRTSAEEHRYLKVALIQSSHDKKFEPETMEDLERKFSNLRNITHTARFETDHLDLIVWPEASFGYDDYLSGLSGEYTQEVLREAQFMAWQAAAGKPAPFKTAEPMLVGTLTRDPKNRLAYNSAILFDEEGQVRSRYYKNHLVMFGEYFPLVQAIPGINKLFANFGSLSFGDSFTAMETGGFTVAPNICFESTVPHFIRRQMNSLESDPRGVPVDVMVNLTNDGWFMGTSCLDLHLACNIFRAVEMRKPMLVCSNTGFSAHIDEFGRLIKVGPRRKEAELICDVRIPLHQDTIYRSWGAWFAAVCGGLAVLSVVVSIAAKKQ
jgi:apolipoprotein N-acyltransferase